MSSVEHFTCAACTPNMLALCADGNRKVDRFRQSKGSEQPHFDGAFIAKDANVHSFVEDIMSKQKSVGQIFMRPFLSVMHAKAHSTKCEIIWSGRNQEGAGKTAGEKVEMVNSYLSRCGLTTKYMTKSARNDMLIIHAIGWNKRKQDGLHLALSCRYVKTG
ncbi:unnamed protein product [Arctogadus glacialis]